MKVAMIQMDIAWEDPAENLRQVEDWSKEAVAGGAELVVLPEMFSTGFTMDSATAAASSASTVAALQAIARRHGVHIIGGVVEPGSPRPRNASVVLSPEGKELARYRKIHPFTLAGEQRSYAAGTDLLTVKMPDGLRVTPLICYDLRFPEVFRARASVTDLFVVIASWPEKRIDAWRSLLIARAIENQCHVVGVNRVGVAEGVRYPGSSLLIGPDGAINGDAADQATCLVREVSAQAVTAHRAAFSFLADRRPDVYRDFCGDEVASDD